MGKGRSGSKGGGSKSGSSKGGPKVWSPSRPGNNKPSMTGNPSGDGRGNLLPASNG